MAPKTVKGRGRAASAPNKPTPKAKQAPKQAPAEAVSAPAPTPTRNYIRNLHSGAGGSRIRLSSGKDLIMQPRGQVGDLILVSEEQRQDPMYQRNLDFTFEELSVEQGLEVIDKQNINAAAARGNNAGLIGLTNERGETMSGKASIGPVQGENAGVSVGQVSQSGEGSSSRESGNITRPAVGPTIVSVPGSQFNPDVMPAGLSTDQAAIFIETPPNQREALVAQWAEAGVEDYRNSLRVTVDPTQRG